MHKKMIKEIIDKMDTHEIKALAKSYEEAIDLVKRHDRRLYKEIEDLLYVSIFGEHFNEEIAKAAVEEMEFPVSEYKYNHTAEQIENSLKQISQQAKQIMTKYGKKVHEIPEEVNKWDMYYTYNMICADYPLSHGGDMTKIAMLTYEFLSDPDAPCGKAYRYYCAMKDKKD